MITRLLTLGTTTFLILSSALALAHEPPSIDNRPLDRLRSGSLFTLKDDVYINRGETGAALPLSNTEVFSRCFLQAFYAKPNDRVVRAGRVLALRRVTIGQTFIALTVDDGREDRVLAQIGCNLLDHGYTPSIHDIREALSPSFELDLHVTPVEEVFVPAGN